MASPKRSNNNYNEASRNASQTTSGYIHFRYTLQVANSLNPWINKNLNSLISH